nr:hypothetical protein [Yersinia enterocolitica]
MPTPVFQPTPEYRLNHGVLPGELSIIFKSLLTADVLRLMYYG